MRQDKGEPFTSTTKSRGAIMAWVQLITLLSLIQFIGFGFLVAKARGTYGIKAPATTGHEIFERYYRVHMNTLETLVVFVPALWIAAHYWSPYWVTALGAVYLIGRIVYLRGYVADPKGRSAGYALSFLPVIGLVLAGAVGVVRSLLLS